MKYKITHPLEIRTEPSVEGEIIGLLQPGFVFDCVEEEEGQSINGISKWLKDTNGFYYWSGAVEEAFPPRDVKTFTPATSKIPDWNSDNFDVTGFWPQTTGKDIGIAVIDTGIYPHEDLKEAIDESNQRYFISDSIEDTNGHGTHVSGIIAARGKSDLYGVAPGSIIIPLKIGAPPFSNEVLISAINYAASLPEVKIINLSLKANSNNIELEKAIQGAMQKGKIVIAASGNNYRRSVDYPANYKNVIAVAAILRDVNSINETYLVSRDSNYGYANRPVDICAPGVHIESCRNTQNGINIKSGTSMATAYISGIVALKIQKDLYRIHDQNSIREALVNSVFQFATRELDNEKLIKLPVLNPDLFINS